MIEPFALLLPDERDPLLGHRLSDARKSLGAIFGIALIPAFELAVIAVRVLIAAVHPRLDALRDDAGGHERRETTEPETCALGVGMAELPGLDDLGIRRELIELDGRRILHADMSASGIVKRHEKRFGFKALLIALLLDFSLYPKPDSASGGEIGTGRMSDEQIPGAVDFMMSPPHWW